LFLVTESFLELSQFPKIRLVDGNKLVGYDCHYFCLVVKNSKTFSNLLHLRVKMILGDPQLIPEILPSLKLPCKKQGNSSIEERRSLKVLNHK